MAREEVARTLTLKFRARDNSSMVKVQVYVPFPSPGRDTKLPLVVYYHGGGFVVMSAHAYEHNARAMANAVGAIVAVVDYRLAPEHKYPAAHDDALDGLRKAAEWCRRDDRCDISRVALAGDSAGGHLAAATALDAWELEMDGTLPSGLKAQVLLVPIVAPFLSLPSHLRRLDDPILGRGLLNWFWSRYLGDASRDTCDPRLHLLRREKAFWQAVPPAIVVTGHFDPVSDEGEDYARHLHTKNVSVYAARRLEAHVQFAPSTLGWTHGALKALLNGDAVPPCC